MGQPDPTPVSAPVGRPVRVQLECELSPHCEAWIRSRGLTPYAEVPMMGRCVDWIARDGDRVCCVEMKLGLTKDVLRQAFPLQLVTSDVWCYVGRKPRDLTIAIQEGLGVAWFDGLRTVEILQPAARLQPYDNYRDEAIHRTTGLADGGVAGKPTQLGQGPAQECFDRIAAYRDANPSAKWRDVFRDVPNHYSDHKSMQCAMRVVRDTRSYRARRQIESVTP